MGWASGSEIFNKLVVSAKRNIKDEAARERFYRDAIKAFEDSDWDTQDEVRGIDAVLDKVLDELHPMESDDL